jgi:DNA polymerase
MIEAAFAWWEDAGVDGDWSDQPQPWPASTRKAAATKATLAQPVAPPRRPKWAASRATGHRIWRISTWWMETAALPFPPARRIAPSGRLARG